MREKACRKIDQSKAIQQGKKRRFIKKEIALTFYHSKKYAKDAPVLLAFAE